MMNDPIPIQRDAEPKSEEFLLRQQRHSNRMQWAVLAFIGLVVAGFLTPVIVFFTRLALGG